MHIHLPFRNPHRYLGLCAYNHRSESTNLEDLRVSFCLFSHTISTGINDKWPRLCVFFIFQGISRLICNISKTSYSYSFSNNHNLNQIYHLRILPNSDPFQKYTHGSLATASMGPISRRGVPPPSLIFKNQPASG